MPEPLERSLLASLLLCCLVLTPPAPAAPQDRAAPRDDAPAAAVPRIEFEKTTLPNGLQLILSVDRKLPVVHVNQWFHVGSKNEKPGRTGFAHLFEHLMFNGSKNAPGEYFSYIQRIGGGGTNGTTSNDRTNYFATVPSGALEYLLWLESDRVATLADALTQSTLDNQRDVVKNERRQGLENQPYGRAFKLILECLFPQGHPYSWPVIGSHEDLSAATLEDVKEFFRRYYAPNNLSLAIVGDFDPAEAKRLVRKYYGSLPPGPPLERPKRWLASLDREKVVEVQDRVPQERVYLAWPSPAYFQSDEAELDLAATILSDGLSSRLTKKLVYDQQLATDVSAFNMSMEIAGGFVVVATARPGASLARVEQAITQELSRLARSGPTAEELTRAKTKQEYGFVSGLERIGGFGGKADRLNEYNTFLGDPGKLEEDMARYRRVTSRDVRQAVARWLDTPNRVVVRFHPETTTQAAVPPPDRSQPPALGPDRPFQAPEVKSARLENGLEVLVVERPTLPKVAVTLVTRAGSAADPQGREGTANLTVATLDRGTRTRSALEIADALGDLGTSLGGSAGRESSQVSFQVLKRSLEPALAIAADVVRNPTFPEAELDREKKRLLDSLAQESSEPNALASRLRPMLIFGGSHPYGRPARGLPSTVQPITSADLKRFHETYWKPGGSALIFAGDITLEEATGLARGAFGSWSGGAPPALSIPPPQPAPAGRIYLVDRPGAAQTVISQILPGPPRKTEDFYPLSLADTLWGGDFMSRLNLNLREEKGYTYGAGSALQLLTAAGTWFSTSGVQTDKTKEAVAEFVKELQGLAGERPITQQELENVKTSRVRGYAQNFETLGGIVGRIAYLFSQELPMSELQREPQELEQATLGEVSAAARKYAVSSQVLLLLIGDRSKIEPGLRDLGIGPIVLLDTEGNPVSTP